MKCPRCRSLCMVRGECVACGYVVPQKEHGKGGYTHIDEDRNWKVPEGQKVLL